mgnify:FL=1
MRGTRTDASQELGYLAYELRGTAHNCPAMTGRRTRTGETTPSHDAGSTRRSGGKSHPETVPSGAILALLGDQYTRRLLSLLVERPRTGRELDEATEMSRPTIYRRLEQLGEHGLVRTELQFDPDGHHRKRFHATVGGFDFEIRSGEINASTRTPDDDRP